MVDIRGLLATSDDDCGGISSGSQLEKGRGGSSSGKASETGNISKPKGGWFGKCRKRRGPYDRPPWNPLAVPDDSLLLDADIDELVYWEELGERPDEVWWVFGKRKMQMKRKAKPVHPSKKPDQTIAVDSGPKSNPLAHNPISPVTTGSPSSQPHQPGAQTPSAIV